MQKIADFLRHHDQLIDAGIYGDIEPSQRRTKDLFSDAAYTNIWAASFGALAMLVFLVVS